ncbi:hypothetical protein ACILG0_23980 [Pseudomonadota bacterium AL_CKDN230030165-1A_HGKHYDSX7]
MNVGSGRCGHDGRVDAPSLQIGASMLRGWDIIGMHYPPIRRASHARVRLS